MTNIETIKTRLKEQVAYLKQQYHIKKLGIFGSYVRGEETPNSDLDILVEFESGYRLCPDIFSLLTYHF